MLRGNHETSSISRIYGFYDECKRRFSTKLWKTFVDVFAVMPVCALIAEAVLCMHGGIPKDEIASLSTLANFERPCDIPDSGILCDLLWADPLRDGVGFAENSRGISYTFGADVVEKFCEKHNLDLIVRAHEVVEDGYQFFAKRKLLTVFSASNYENKFQNAAGMAVIDENLCGRIEVMKPSSTLKRTREDAQAQKKSIQHRKEELKRARISQSH